MPTDPRSRSHAHFKQYHSSPKSNDKKMNEVMRHGFIAAAVALALMFVPFDGRAQVAQAPNVLIVTAHPDDEALFAGSVYRLTQELGGVADLALVTDGAGGYRFSTLAEGIYGRELTDPAVAREYMPAIRKKELLAAGSIMGLRKYFFLDQPDTGRTTDPDSVLSTVWDSVFVTSQLESILRTNRYDFVLVFLPFAENHGHHKASALLGLQSVQKIEPARQPVVLGAWISSEDDTTAQEYHGLEGYPLSRTTSVEPLFRFDRTHSVPENERLNYKIPVNWVIAEHKTQGTMQLLMNQGDYEEYWLFEANPADARERAAGYFELLNSFSDE